MPSAIRSRAPSKVATFPAIDLHVGEAMLRMALMASMHARGVTVCGVDREDVGFGFHDFDGAFEEVAGGADSGADAQAAVVVFAGARIFEFLLDVFYGDEAFEVEVLIDDEKFFDAVFLQDAFGFFERGADGDGDEIVFGHDRADELIVIFFEAQIAVGENPSESRAAGDGHAGDMVFLHDFERWRSVMSGEIVTGSTIMPLSERFTGRLLRPGSMGMLRCTMPMPPWRAIAMARCDSVTVSIAARGERNIQGELAR